MAKSLFDLSGKVTLVTGGNSGLGLGFARGVARQGGAVEIWARNAEKNAKAKAELESFGVKVTARQVDVSSEAAVKQGYKELIADHGRIDGVFANAGVPAGTRSLLDTTSEQWHNVLAVNMHGAFYTLQEGARLMVERAKAGEPGGALVFCGSLSMFQGRAGLGQYAAAKAGIGSLIRCMAVELGQYGIRANTVAPGYVKTEMMGPLDTMTPIDKAFAASIPMGRPGYASDFEGIAAYLVSDASAFHTGDTIVIDGADLIKNRP
jgi:NAD(P)-dependent dehydrogenase (short-subunit alcohol dehydrogenase family)